MTEPSRIAFDWLERHNMYWPEKEAIVDLHSGRKFTYGQFNERANKLANAMREKWGINKGDRIAILSKNSPEFLELFFATAKLGAIMVPINIRLVAEEILYILNDCTPVAFMYEEGFEGLLSEVADRNEVPNRLIINKIENGASETNYENFIQSSPGTKPPLDEEVSLDDIHTIIYTSGTTGFPKGAIATHGNILFNAVNTFITGTLSNTDVLLLSLPLFHTGGLNVRCTPMLHLGAKIVIMRDFDPGKTLEVIQKKEVNILFFVATMWVFVAQHPDFEKTDFSNIRLAWSGGEPLPMRIQEAFRDKGSQLVNVYGLTESGPLVTWMSADDVFKRMGSCGQPSFHCDLRVVDDEGNEVAVDEVGEVIFRGPWYYPRVLAESRGDR